jgi:hypothetical protein
MLAALARRLLDAAFPALAALLAAALIAATLDSGGECPELPGGPGLTLDESFNVEQGVYLVESLRVYGFGLLDPESVREVFGQPEYLPDHPPLGRLWLGAFHMFGPRCSADTAERVPGFASARFGSAVAFGLTVFLVGFATSGWYGRIAGTAAALSLVLMPRLVGHAHLAALETFVGLTYTAAVLSLAAWWSGRQRPSWKAAIVTGALFGLALLSKIQAVLIPIPVVLWALYRWRLRAIVPLCVWGLSAGVVFFALWPWLWLDPIEHARTYLLSATQRTTLYVWYFAERYGDREVPWHYPAVMFLCVVPLGLQALGFLGLASRENAVWRDARAQLVLLCTLFPLCVFSAPNVVVYDGARLFLVVFPLWAVFIGRGLQALVAWLRQRSGPLLAWSGAVLLVGAQAYGLYAVHPVYLSYYNLGVGGLRGAERLGLELNYWGDSITREFLEDVVETVPQGTGIEVFPVLHEFQLQALERNSPLLKQHQIRLRPYLSHEPSTKSRYVLIFRREADLQDFWKQLPAEAQIVVQLQREGVMLAALYLIPPTSRSAP